MRRQWSINGRFVTQSVTGVQRYAQGIVRALDQLLCEDHPRARGFEMQLLVPPDSTEATPARRSPSSVDDSRCM
jgi:hypothetical protein